MRFKVGDIVSFDENGENNTDYAIVIRATKKNFWFHWLDTGEIDELDYEYPHEYEPGDRLVSTMFTGAFKWRKKK